MVRSLARRFLTVMPDPEVAREVVADLDKVDVYTTRSVGNAPDKVGLYAWYSIPNIGKPDWEEDLEDGRDLGAERFTSLLDRHTSRHKKPPLNARMDGAFGQLLAGKVKDVSYPKLSEAKHNLPNESFINSLIDTIQHSSCREEMVMLLPWCSPLLSAPIYIGVTHSLQERLRRHVSDLRGILKDFRGRSIPDDFGKGGKKTTFAVRAARQGFSVENLYVLTLTTESDQRLDKDTIRNISEAVEWLLNRWHKPILGRD